MKDEADSRESSGKNGRDERSVKVIGLGKSPKVIAEPHDEGLIDNNYLWAILLNRQ